MPRSHPRPWHRGSVFGDGPRRLLDKYQRKVWKARTELNRRAGRITDGEYFVCMALLKRLGPDGRCDPSHATLATDSGESESTVKRALKAFQQCGLVTWARRLIRNGWRSEQTSKVVSHHVV
jgi:DNA-binding MarR family transcriptional regulator